jgi:hypothetical protein
LPGVRQAGGANLAAGAPASDSSAVSARRIAPRCTIRHRNVPAAGVKLQMAMARPMHL